MSGHERCHLPSPAPQVILDEYDLRSNVMRQRLARDLFSGVVDALVAGAPHLQGVEWEAVVLVSVLPCFTLASLVFMMPMGVRQKTVYRGCLARRLCECGSRCVTFASRVYTKI